MIQNRSKSKNIDLWIYATIVLLLAFYGLYIKSTCEELGCLAVVVPIIGIMGLSVIECIVNIVYLLQKRKFNPARAIIFTITLIFTLLLIGSFLIGKN